MAIIKPFTPFKTYSIHGKKIFVKREDLCCPSPGPGFSKIRGVEEKLSKLKQAWVPKNIVGVVDTRHSKAGWGVSYLAQKKGFKCVVYYPKLKNDDGIRIYQKKCLSFGAKIIPLKATMSAVLYNQAKKLFMEKYPLTGFMFPNGLKLYETIECTRKQVIQTTPKKFIDSKSIWIVSISSGTIGAGVIKGLIDLNFEGKIILHEGYSRPQNAVKKYIYKMINTNNVPFKMEIIDEGFQYKDSVNIKVPFPCNPWYDRKAWKWLVENINNLKKLNIVFWNIGE